MSYYSSSKSNHTLAELIVLLIILFILYGITSSPDSEWNNGVCPKCEVRYELRGVSRNHLKYYACSECGSEVTRY